MHSHTPLIPLISGYLLFTYRDTLSRALQDLPVASRQVCVAQLVALACLLSDRVCFRVSRYSRLPPRSRSFSSHCCLFLYCGGFLFLGAGWMRSALFPLAFLIFSIPLPFSSKQGSRMRSSSHPRTQTAVFFSIFQVPFVRDGVIFQLPGITIEVAQECSGIRSTYVLFITSLLISYLFLRSPWRRAVLVAAIIPLGIIRNGFRILVIGWLCVEVDPHMIDSFIHRKEARFSSSFR